MVALLQVERLFSEGLPALPHGAPDARYKRILQGDFSVPDDSAPLALALLAPSMPYDSDASTVCDPISEAIPFSVRCFWAWKSGPSGPD